MAILLSSTLGDTGAHVVWKDPLGRAIAIKARIRNVPTMIIASHADSHTDSEQALFYEKLRSHIPYDPECTYVWLMDANNVSNPTLDARRSDGKQSDQTRPNGVSKLHVCAQEWGGVNTGGTALQDAFRCRYPNATEFARHSMHSEHLNSWRRIDRIYV